jgi:tetratricopeptide (TPR) repeat protein
LVLAHRLGGIPGTVILKTLFVVATWALLYLAARRLGAKPIWTALVLALAAWSAEPRFVERPHLVTFLGLAGLLRALVQAEAGRSRWLWAFVPLGLFWANANSCFFLAPSLLVLYGWGARWDGRQVESRRAWRIAACLFPLIFCTPSGFAALGYLANHWRMPFVRPLEEYRHAAWPVDGPFVFLSVGVVGLLAVAVIRKQGKTLPARFLLPTVALGLLGALRIRFVAEFSMLAGVVLSVRLSALLPTRRWMTPAAAGALLALFAWPRVEAARAGQPILDLGIEADLVPTAAIDFVNRNRLRDHLYNDMEVGSYLTWEGWPRHRVFQDPRINSYPESFHAVLRRSDLSREQWRAFLDGFGVRAAMITYPDVNPRGAWFDPAHFGLVYRAKDGLVFVRRPVPDHLPELPLTFSFSRETGLVPEVLPTRPGAGLDCDWRMAVGEYVLSVDRKAEALSAYDQARTLSPDGGCGARARLAFGSLSLRMGKNREAKAALAAFTDGEGRINYGFARLALGEIEPALSDFDHVLAGDPHNDQATFGRGTALAALARTPEAIAAFRALLDRSPEHLSAPAARAALARLEGTAR